MKVYSVTDKKINVLEVVNDVFVILLLQGHSVKKASELADKLYLKLNKNQRKENEQMAKAKVKAKKKTAKKTAKK
jgi:hypothetical protein